jgi:hypothetical protein
MAAGAMGKFFGPVGMVLVLVGVVVAILTFIFILLDLSGDFVSRVVALNGSTTLAFILGGAALTWLGGRPGGSGIH